MKEPRTMKTKRKSPKKPSKVLALRPVERKDLRRLRNWKNDPLARRWVGDGTRTFSEEDRWWKELKTKHEDLTW